MKNILLKFRDGLVIGAGIICAFGIVNAWTGLQADSGDSLTSAKWNELVDKVDGIFTDSNGNIGIGTSTPIRKLHISNLTGAQIMLESTGNTNWNGIDLKTGAGTYNGYFGMLDSNGTFFIDAGSNGDDLVIKQDGKVGIGTTNPNFNLNINGVLKFGDESDSNGGTVRVANGNCAAHQVQIACDTDTAPGLKCLCFDAGN